MDKKILNNRKKREKLTALFLAGAILVSCLFPVLPGMAAEDEPEPTEIGDIFENTASPELIGEDPTPYGTPDPSEGSTDAEETATPDETEEPTPVPTPVPEYAPDGSEYLNCGREDNPTVSMEGAWKFSRISADSYEKYQGEPIGTRATLAIPGLLKDAEALHLEKSLYVTGLDKEDKSVILTLSRAFYCAKIYVNGKWFSTLNHAFAQTETDITEGLTEGENRIDVLLAAGQYSSYKTGSFVGVQGDVTVSCVDRSRILAVYVDPDPVAGTLDLTVDLQLSGPEGEESVLEVNAYELGIKENGTFGTHKGAGTYTGNFTNTEGNTTQTASFRIFLRNFSEQKLWSPDNPYLYELQVNLNGKSRTVVFGIRSVRSNEDNGYLCINEKPVFVAGITLNQEILQALQLNREEQIESFLRLQKSVGVNCVKGAGLVFPKTWYQIADEVGMLLISELPLGRYEDGTLTENQRKEAEKTRFAGQFEGEVLGVVNDLYNFASCCYWDLAGEDFALEGTDELAQKVWDADRQHRPIGLGRNKPWEQGGVADCDVSLLGGNIFENNLEVDAPLIFSPVEPDWNLKNFPGTKIVGKFAMNILLGREGEPVDADSAAWWNAKLSSEASSQERILAFYDVVELLLQYWRGSRRYNGILLPAEIVKTGLTGDSENPIDQKFLQILANNFAPIGINVEFYASKSGRGDALAMDVSVTNNDGADLSTVDITFRLTDGQTVLYEETKQYDSLKKLGTEGRDFMQREFSFTVPKTVEDGTVVTLLATYEADGKTVTSRRILTVSGGEEYESPYSGTVVLIALAAMVSILLATVFVASLKTLRGRGKRKN